MGSKTVNRYVWLFDVLLRNKQLTYQEISDLWEKSSLSEGQPFPHRTFHMHKNAVEEMFGVEIKCNKSSGYHYYLSGLDNFRKDRNRQWLFNSFTLSNMIDAGRNMQGRIVFENIPHGNEYLQTVIDAMQQNRVLEVDYQPFVGQHDVYHLSPYAMKVYDRRWYVVGMIKESAGIRNMALDRVIDMTMTVETFHFPKKFNADEYYADTVGIYVNDKLKPEKVRIRVSGGSVDYLRSLPLHWSQEEVLTRHGEYSEFTYRLCLTPELASKLLAMGENVEVLEPTELRDLIKTRLESALNAYRK